jgi:hypothetical protein
MQEDECTLADVRVMGPNKLGVGLSLGIPALIIGLMAFAAMKVGLPNGKDAASFFNVMFLTLCGGGAGAYLFSRVLRKPSREAGELRATKNGVYWRGKRIAGIKDIKTAVLWPGRGDGAYVRIKRHGIGAGDVVLQLRTADEGRKLLRVLGFDATQDATPLAIHGPSVANMKSRVRGTWLGGVTMFAGMISAMVLAKAGLGPLAALAGLSGFLFHATMIVRLFRKAQVVVGADGVYVSWLWHKQFIPIRDIVRAEVVEGDTWATMYPVLVRIHTHGEPIDLVATVGRTTGFGIESFRNFAHMHAETVAERINEAVKGRGEGSSSALAWSDDVLTRGERAIGEWVEALRGIRERIQTFRTAAGEGDVFGRLWEILEDVQAPAAKRAAAAVALSPHLDDQGRERLRIAAQATATPKLRIALEAAAEDDDERLLSTLEEVAASEETHQAARVTESA